MFDFLFRKRPQTADLSFIGVDMHNHLLPGIDDGSPDPQQSLRLMEGLLELGYKGFVCTPHVISDVHPNTPKTISGALGQLQSAMKQAGLECPVACSAEYMINFDFESLVANGDILPFGGRRQVLIEMSYAVESPNIREAIFDLLTHGFEPILAHPERYMYYHHKPDTYHQLVDAGCDLQVNLLSLIGYYGKPVKVMAEKLIERGIVQWVGTDLHHERHLDALQKLATDARALRTIEKIRDLKNPSLLVTA